jgi:acetoin utilization protein AcuC
MGDPVPLLVFGPRSTTYDFGPGHPLTPRRFGPAIDLLRAVGAEPGLAPAPASDEDLLLVHSRDYVEAVKEWSSGLDGPWDAGIGPGGDNPAFPGMHEAGAMVAGGSMRAMEAILGGDVEHAFHPGGGLHHAMRDRAAGFCIYDDPALAIAQARRAGLRVLYVDLDVHHGDGVEAIHRDDPGVMTVSFHETGRYLFPGTGFPREFGEGTAAGTALNITFEPGAGEEAWLHAVSTLVPQVAAAFGPDIVVSQHGADSHAWDPLAHLRNTTTAMGEAARIVDRVTHRWARGRWLSTGGGGYDAYRVVPRTWSLVWLAGAHRDAPATTPAAWRERWAAEATRYGQAPLPQRFEDEPNAGEPVDGLQRAAEDESLARLAITSTVLLPAFVRAASALGWDALGEVRPESAGEPDGSGEVEIVSVLTAAHLGGLRLAARVLPLADTDAARSALRTVLGNPGQPGSAEAAAAVDGTTVVGLAVFGATNGAGTRSLLAVGVAPAYRRRGLAGRLLRELASRLAGDLEAVVTVAERDAVDPLDHRVRVDIGRRLLARAGFEVGTVAADFARVDRLAIVGRRPG